MGEAGDDILQLITKAHRECQVLSQMLDDLDRWLPAARRRWAALYRKLSKPSSSSTSASSRSTATNAPEPLSTSL